MGTALFTVTNSTHFTFKKVSITGISSAGRAKIPVFAADVFVADIAAVDVGFTEVLTADYAFTGTVFTELFGAGITDSSAFAADSALAGRALISAFATDLFAGLGYSAAHTFFACPFAALYALE